ncbi:MAG: autotransporter outer membrane beta-barrel domain-containing protein [Alphaproteobacteria bacterium]|nr:autotransporter outer membrane beta-barrel domain-containing protein [Alphaproteobacteria bacterium]
MFKHLSRVLFVSAVFFSLCLFEARAQEAEHSYIFEEGADPDFPITLYQTLQDGTLTSKDYTLVFKNAFGDAQGSKALFYRWNTSPQNGYLQSVADENLARLIFRYKDAASYAKVYNMGEVVVDVPTNPYIIAAAINLGAGQTASFDNYLFENNHIKAKKESGYSTVLAGLIYNNETATITSLSADFVKNSFSHASGSSVNFIGGVMVNDGKIEKFKGNFVENISVSDSAILFNRGEIGLIEANFIHNYADASYVFGGAVNNSGKIDSIKGAFIGNYAAGNQYSPSWGAVMYNGGTIGEIAADFIGNGTFDTGNIYSVSYFRGGAIANMRTIGSVKGDFIKNQAREGGAIFLEGSHSKIDSIYGRFIENQAVDGGAINVAADAVIELIEADFISNTANYGGAIQVTGDIKSLSGNFFGNKAVAPDEYGESIGGAIYLVRGNVNIVGNARSSTFRGNYHEKNGERIYNAIWVEGGKLSLTAKNGGSVNMYDGIVSLPLAEILLTGDSSGTINLYADIKDGKVTTENDFKFNTANDELFTYGFSSLTSDEKTKYFIDVDAQAQESDVFKTTEQSSGKVTLHGLQFKNLDVENLPSSAFLVQVLQTQDDNLQLALGVGQAGQTSYKIGEAFASVEFDTINASTKWAEDYYQKTLFYDIIGSLSLATKDTTNDSLGVKIERVEDGAVKKTMMGDTLALVAGSDLANKTFFAGSASDEYVFAKRFEDENPSEFVEGVGDVVGELNVSGVISGDLRSKLNLNQRKGFSLTAPSALTLSNIEITNATDFVVDNVTVDRSLMLLNANLKNNITDDKAVINAFDGGNVVIKADGADSVFDNPAARAGVDIDGGMLDLQTQNGGNIVFNDKITGNLYNVSVDSDEKGKIRFNKNVTGADVFSITENSNIALGVEAVVNAENIFALGESVFLTIDAEVDRQNNTINTGKLQASTDLEGKFAIIVNSLNPYKLDDDNDAITPFLFAPNDDLSTQTEVFVSRVLGSPYMWEALLNARGETAGSTWYLAMRGNENGGNEVAPEVLGAIGLHESAIEQTRSVARNISSKLAARKECVGGCGVYDHAYNGEKLSNAWVLIEGQTADVKKPVDVDVKTKGIDAGFDVQSDAHNNLGVFGSYIKGRHNMSGKGKKVYSTIGAKADIESFLAGLYYRFDKNYNFLFASVYGGVLQAKVKSKDGLAKLKTDGVELGAALEAGRTLLLSKHVSLTPMVGLYFMQIDFDATKDNVGKHYRFDNIKHLEAELALRLARDFANGNVYVQPAVVQNITRNDKIKITDIQKQPTYHDQTLGRLEVGGRYDLGEQLSGYISGKYTFGSNYRSLAGTLGLSYAF